MTTAPKSSDLANDSFAVAIGQQRLVRHLDLFSGIGGFALAAKWCGWKTIGFSEIEPYAIRTLQSNWPTVRNHGDICKMRGVECDIITGGFPCQPYSVAGKKLGSSDPRNLWPQMLRVIRESRPAWVIGENSPNIRTMALDKIISDLEAEGFSCQTFDIPACGVGAWHKRSRYWVVAYCERNDNRGGDCPRWRVWKQEEITEMGAGENGYGDSEPAVARMVHGVPNQSHRLRGLGNAIFPQVAYEIMRGISLTNVACSAAREPSLL